MGAESVECPGEIGLDGNAACAACGDDAEKNARAVCALGAAGEENVEPELGDVLELALGGGVVDRDVGVINEAKERVAVSNVALLREIPVSGRGSAVSVFAARVLAV